MSYVNTQKFNAISNLCQDPNTKGFDLQAGQSWIYPTNYPIREYQYNITQVALHKNTLVSLPTGLGKTFIAAVVMYNFYRWYPHDKIIFMAPTRPLVKQQMDACYNIMAIPPETTSELTGTKGQQSRSEIWQSKRVFFITPQVLQNDLDIILDLGAKVKCLVFDEAHKAKGNHAYCEVIRKMVPKNKLFRVLALSATPGNSSRDVVDVMQNLLIAHVEFRSEDSPDVRPFVFDRPLETVVVPLGDKLQQVKDQYEQILEKYTRTLVECKVIYGNCANLTKGKIFMIKKEFQAKNSGNRYPRYSEIMKSLNICITLYHAYEALIRCGLRVFFNFFEEHKGNPLLWGIGALMHILDDLREYLGPAPEVELLPEGTYAPISPSCKFGHPKFYQLRDILEAHFKNSSASSRVMVFFEYKESVEEAYALLTQSHPLIRPRIFVGQGSGVTQKIQINTVNAFREGTCNTLLSTCIGEEGLDVGEVDLIVCFDIANKSPIRMIQRMGRTGRKKDGRIIVLVTQGREQQTLKDCLVYKNNLGDSAMNPKNLEGGKYSDNPKMIPSYIQPKCEKIFITVRAQPVLTKNSSLKDMLRKMTSSGPRFPHDLEMVEVKERIQTNAEHFWNKNNPLSSDFEAPKINFSKHLEKQRALQECGRIKHSKTTKVLVSLLQFADSKRYNIPVNQNLTKFTTLKQGDIRSMFIKSTQPNEEFSVPTQFAACDKEKGIALSYPAELFQEISNYLSIKASVEENCLVCRELFQCSKMFNNRVVTMNVSTWVLPDLAILDTITAQDLELFANSLIPKSKELCADFNQSEIFENIPFTQFENQASEKPAERSFAFETPKNFEKIFSSFSVRVVNAEVSLAYDSPKSFLGTEVPEKQTQAKCIIDHTPKSLVKDVTLFGTDVPEKQTHSKCINGTVNNSNELISFFKLSSLEELFTGVDLNKTVDVDKTIVHTPDISPSKFSPKSADLFEQSPDLFASPEEKNDSAAIIEAPESPALATYVKSQELKAKKKLFESKDDGFLSNLNVSKPNLTSLNEPQKSFFHSRSKTPIKSGSETLKKPPSVMEIGDVCDPSNLGLTQKLENSKSKEKGISPQKKNHDILDASDICVLSVFGLLNDNKVRTIYCGNESKKRDKTNTSSETSNGKNVEVQTKSNKSGLEISNFCDLSSSRQVEEPVHKRKRKDLCIGDTGDISGFFSETSKDKDVQNESSNKELKMSDVCDFSSLPPYKKPIDKRKEKDLLIGDISNTSSFVSESSEGQNGSSGVELKMSDLFDFSSFLNSSVKHSPKKIKHNLKDQLRIDFIKTRTDKETNRTAPQTPANWKRHNMEQENQTSNKEAVDRFNNYSSRINSPNRKMSKPDNDTLKTNIIDLTGSDCERSSVNSKVDNTTRSELSITQMVSLMAKIDTSQKGRSFATQKPHVEEKSKNRKKVLQLKPVSNVKSDKPQMKKNKEESTPKKKKTLFDMSPAADSDDDFEASPIFVKPKPLGSPRAVTQNRKPSTDSNKKPKKLFCEFLDQEAVDDGTVSEDEGSGEDCFEASFVTDNTQDSLNTTFMQAKYLQSVKSPVGRGRFKIPDRPRRDVSYIYSQDVGNEDNSYVDDSFCVNTQDIDNTQRSLSPLEILEMKLKERKKSKKRKKSSEKSGTKRRLIVISDDSD